MSQISHQADPWLPSRRGSGRSGWPDFMNPRRAAVWTVAALVAGSAPVFFRTFLTDMDFYTHVADKLLHGGVLYRDAIDTKPPAIFFHYALVFRLFGENNVAAVKVVTIAFAVLTAVAVGAIWRELFDGRRAPVASLLFAFATVSGWGPDFLSSNTEILANLFIAGGVYCLCKDAFTRRRRWLFAAGVFIGTAFLYRFQSGAPLAAYFLLLVLQRRSIPSIAGRLWPIALGFALPSAAVIAVYAAMGALPALADFLRYDYYYVRGGAIYWPALLAQAAIVLVSQVVFLALALSQAGRIVRHRIGAAAGPPSEADLFLVLWLGWTVLSFFAGGRFFAHYFVQAVPVVVLLATARLTAGGAASVRDSLRETRASALFRWALVLIPVHAALFTIVNGVFLWQTREPANPYPALVSFARAHTSKADPIFVWTSRTHVLFDMDRIYATRFISNDFLVGRMYGTRHRLASATADSARVASVRELWPLLLHDLESDPPRLIIDDTREHSNFTLDHYPELQAFVERRYEPCRPLDGFCVYVRRP
jgi:hypothetical protein